MNEPVMIYGVEITLDEPDSFLLVKETLTRIGVPSFKDKVLYQSCHILHKRGKYYIVHFKELFSLDGKPSTLNEEDIARRNTIVGLLDDWELISISLPEKLVDFAPMNTIKIVSFKDKSNWQLVPKYSIGIKHA